MLEHSPCQGSDQLTAMSQPQKRFEAHDKTVFYTEGQTLAVLVERNAQGRRRRRVLRVATAEGLLAWCRDHAAALLYLPNPASQN